jgi:hypothetical protein
MTSVRSGSLVRTAVLAILAAGGTGWAKSYHRTGMAEVGFRSWSLERTTLDEEPVDQVLFGAGASWFVNDNISLGIEMATFGSSPMGDSVVLDAVAKLFWWPLSAVTPWTSAGAGGVFGLPEGNVIRARAGLGIRWIPPILDDALAIDLQILGVERWRQDWAVEYVDEDQPSGRIEWSMTRSPWAGGRGFLRGSSPLAWPILGVAWRF